MEMVVRGTKSGWRAIVIDCMVDGIDVVVVMDAIICLGTVTVSEVDVTFDCAGTLCAMSLRQESGESCE